MSGTFAKLPKSRKVHDRYYHHCVVPNCTTNELEHDGMSNLSFHTFPSNTTTRNEWLAWLSEPTFVLKKDSRICSVHFTSVSFEKSARLYESMGLAKPVTTRLKRGACPSVRQAGLNIDEQLSSHRASVSPAASCSSIAYVTKESNISDTTETIANVTPMDTNVSSIHRPSKRSLEIIEKDYSHLTIPSPIKITSKRCQPSQAHPQNIPGFLCNKRIQTNETMKTLGDHSRSFSTKKGKHALTQAFGSQIDEDIYSLARSMVDNNDVVYDIEQPTTQDTDQSTRQDTDQSTTQDTDESYAASQLASNDIFETRQFDTESNDPVKEKKYFVFESALLQLFTFCHMCLAPSNNSIQTKGSMVTITSVCHNSHKTIWHSQPTTKNQTPIGNILLAASSLFSGLNPTQTLRMLKNFGLQVFERGTYFRLQKAYLLRAIKTVWESEQECILNSLKDQELSIGGDGRMDSPGFYAKYGSYTFLETSVKKVIHQALVQSNEVANSVAIELESLTRGLQFLVGRGFKIKNIITDRHIQVRAFLKRAYPTICHYFDVWHLVKSVKKKIHAASKKPTDILRQWSRSIQTHLYWLASTSEGNGDLMRAKWLSLLRHVTNQHQGHGEPFDCCEHDDIEEKYWFDTQSDDYDKLKRIVGAVKKDVGQLSPIKQTLSVEPFHSVVIHFAPINTHYTYHGMAARLTLAALHYNENSNKIQALKSGKHQRRWAIFWPKAKGGEVSVRPIMEASTYEYVSKVLNCAMELASDSQKEAKKKSNEEPLTSKYT